MTSTYNRSNIMRTAWATKHASLETLRQYDRRVNVFKDHAGDRFL